MVQLKTNTTILSELRTFLKAYSRLLDTGDTSIIKDFILVPLSIAGGLLYDRIIAVKNLFLLSQTTTDDLDLEATNYKLERGVGTNAVVTLVFYSATRPTVDVNIPLGTTVSTVGTSFTPAISFTVNADHTFQLASLDTYYSYDRGRYEFPVNAVATTTGAEGNVGSNTIVSLSGTISGVTGVTNLLASSGGSDQESDEDIRNRIQLAKTGRDINTINGLAKFIRSLSFTGAYPVRVEDAASERASGIDVFVIDYYTQTATETFTYTPGTPRHYFSYGPARTVASVTSAFLGVLPSTAYSAVIDNTSPLRRSPYAADYIEIDAAAGVPPGDVITVTYTYSADIYQTQSTIEQDDNNVLTAEVLIKRAFPLYLRLNASLSLKSNADGPTIRNRARNALIQYLATYRLGENIQESDLIVVLQSGYGEFPISAVDSVVINSFSVVDEFGTVILPVNENITVSNKQYIVFGSATLT